MNWMFGYPILLAELGLRASWWPLEADLEDLGTRGRAFLGEGSLAGGGGGG